MRRFLRFANAAHAAALDVETELDLVTARLIGFSDRLGRGPPARRSLWSQRREDHQDLVSGVVGGEPELAGPAACYLPAEPAVKAFEAHSAAHRQVELLQAHLVTGNFPEPAHQGRSDACVPAHELRLQVADNTPVRDERAGIAAEGHPSCESAADTGKQYPASAWVEAVRKSIDCRADVTNVDWRKRESRRAACVRDRYPACSQLLPHRRISLTWVGELENVEVRANRHGVTVSPRDDMRWTQCLSALVPVMVRR
jgi:hypothetical protein